MKLVLLRAMHYYADRGLALTTQTNYRSQVKGFIMLCLYWELSFLPADDITLAMYLVFMSQTVKPSSLKGYLSAIKSLALDRGHPFTRVAERHLVSRVLQGLKRVHGTAPERKMPITPTFLLKILQCVDSTYFDVAWWAAALIAFYLMLRKDNVSVSKAESFHPRTSLLKGDFALPRGYTWKSEDILVVWVRLRHSKTNQFLAKTHTVPLVAIPDSPMCPVNALKRLMKCNSGAPDTAHAFAIPTFGPHGSLTYEPMTHSRLALRLKQFLAFAGLDPT
jgi:hypothetical protein